jgi:hypothetical protein
MFFPACRCANKRGARVDELHLTPLGHASPSTPEPATPKRAPAHYLWAVVRITKVFAGEWWPIKGAILALRRLKCLAVDPYPSIEVDL